MGAVAQDPLALLAGFVARERHALVPKAHIEGGFPLGQWVAKRRLAYQQGRSDPERSSRLEQLPGWSWTPQDDRWRHAYDRLRRFVEREGHAFVRQDAVEDGLRLGVWVWEQRRAYKRGRLSPERTALLDDLPGWVWDAPAHHWEQHYAKLQTFVERTAHARVPNSHVEGDERLGEWVRAQRRFYRRGILPADRAARLEALPGWMWGPKESRTPTPMAAPTASVPTRQRSRSRDRAATLDAEWLNARGAAALCGLSRQTIHRLVDDGLMPASGGGGDLRIRRSDVEAFISSSRIVAGSPDAEAEIS
jgi:excisionase family DNA binding protein